MPHTTRTSLLSVHKPPNIIHKQRKRTKLYINCLHPPITEPKVLQNTQKRTAIHNLIYTSKYTQNIKNKFPSKQSRK